MFSIIHHSDWMTRKRGREVIPFSLPIVKRNDYSSPSAAMRSWTAWASFCKLSRYCFKCSIFSSLVWKRRSK